jgi:hypothetical protein
MAPELMDGQSYNEKVTNLFVISFFFSFLPWSLFVIFFYLFLLASLFWHFVVHTWNKNWNCMPYLKDSQCFVVLLG